ncbi:MAG: hypothetical protein IPI67_14055 [Myxococcales bacterium]|nr:hypothetical protein [Myxococcales bacterium]
MKKLGLAFVLMTIAGGATAVACGGDDFGSCEANNDCGTGGKDGGTGATGGTSGTGGTGGTGNTGGTSGTGGTGNTGGTAGSGGVAGGDGGTCDTTKSPSEAPCLVSDENAIFVSPSGSAGGAGTKASPLKSFADAVAKAKTAGHGRVIACNGDDDELSLTTAADGIKVYGGFKCADWSLESSARANLKPSTRGIVLTLDTLAAGATFEDVGFFAMAGSDPGESSVAAFVKESGAISMKRVRLEAGKGAKGATGTKTDFNYPAQTTLDGKNASGDTGAAFNQCTCPDGTKTTGAKGGDGGVGATGGGLGQPDLGAGKGGVIGSCSPGGTGGDGNPGAAVTPSDGAKTLGTLASGGWLGTPGTDGKAGGPGQGGGGGAGSATSGGGGGGGCGACGGAPGKGGGAGGSSIALLALNTAVSLDTCEVIARDAGDGGSGIAGQTGQQIAGFGGVKVGGGCNGGNGGKGADGGAGGGGAGGVSAGVVSKGKPVTLTATSPQLGNKGNKGVGGKPGTNDGIDGDAKATMEVQ